MRNLSFLICLSLIVLTSGCATIICGTRQTVKFASTPTNASVLIDEVNVGQTPFETRLKRDREYKVVIKLDGYLPYETKLTKEFNAWYIGNIVFGGLIGLIIDPITGAIYKLSPKELNAQLQQGTTSSVKTEKNQVYIAVSLQIDKNWEKIGQMEKL
ncbi:MAG: PEGA domain-containing protein [Dysgonamonadaceae bacterium]